MLCLRGLDSMSKYVLFEEAAGAGGHVGLITLNRPNALNSLNFEMIQAIHSKLQSWAVDKEIKAVIIRAVPGRAFCAGGDLRLTYESMQTQSTAAMQFFHEEYLLNAFIHHYPKPYIALLDGITMGGGVGISIHGSHRVVTERLLFAMPETGIGFFPDVGATYFLPRLPNRVGYYLGLTGARLDVNDSVAIGIAQYRVDSAALTNIVDAIIEQPFTNDAKASVSEILQSFAENINSSELTTQQDEINHCFSKTSIEEILDSVSSATGTLCQAVPDILAAKSPTSLKVSLYAFMQGSRLDFDHCMNQERNLAEHFAKGHDFKEGIRAVIIDKDQRPHWQPNQLSAVTEEMVASYFARVC